MHVYGMYGCMTVNILIPNTRECAHTHRHTHAQSDTRTHTHWPKISRWLMHGDKSDKFQQEMNTFWIREALASDTSFSLSFSRSDRTSPSKYLFAIPTRSSPNPTFGRWGSMDTTCWAFFPHKPTATKSTWMGIDSRPRTCIAARKRCASPVLSRAKAYH